MPEDVGGEPPKSTPADSQSRKEAAYWLTRTPGERLAAMLAMCYETYGEAMRGPMVRVAEWIDLNQQAD